jgi:hypothetical protein
MDEIENDNRPDSWIEDLSDLIQRKRAENEVLKKICTDILPDTYHELSRGGDVEAEGDSK